MRRDALGQWWSGPFAGAADVRALLAEGVADALLPATRPDYPIDDMMLTGLSAKSTLEAVIAAVETMLAHPTVAEAAARASVIFEAGLGAGLCTLLLCEALERAGRREVTLWTSDAGETALLGLVNLARAGHAVRIVDPQTDALTASAGAVDVGFVPWGFDDPLPAALRGRAELVVADHTIVYVGPGEPGGARQQRFARRVNTLLEALAPGGVLVVSEINDAASSAVFEAQKRRELRRLRRRLFRLQLGAVVRRLRAFVAASKVKAPLERLQLQTASVTEVLDGIGERETLLLNGGLVLAHVVRRR
ncbi:MAG: hypothetical protein KC620_07935 [Myxococcales bacterium]|nr:hypothetical protein [Myxococcales bacterium]